ncbi:polymer-forming cytoskeletal protein [Salmonella enterica]|nr:polymer-forming cytoskeletal protein [Salmonella enterica]EAA9598676.1 polymer-forming cytoskeletal protein [Salmonella enterica]EAO9641717.1 polymer-forming cytoskeletal protein [Salmonella enterica]
MCRKRAACSEEETALIIKNDEKLPLSDAMASPEILPAGQCIPPWPQECISGEIFVSRGCGQVTGDITAPEGTVVVSGRGSVEGKITCQRLEVNGEVRGMCTAGNAEIGATGSVTGGLRYGSLTVQPGGGLCGEISQQDPPSDGAELPEKLVQRKDIRKTSPAVDSGDDSGQ